jgi:hypothetical protein
MEIKMTAEQKKEKILAAAATFGSHVGIYWNEAKELEAAGLIERKTTYTKAGGNQVDRWFIKK